MTPFDGDIVSISTPTISVYMQNVDTTTLMLSLDGLNVTTVIFANRAYAVLQWEYSGIGVGAPGSRAADLFAIGRPDIDWVMMAKSMGIPATRATSLDTFGELLKRGFAAEGPSLIEISL